MEVQVERRVMQIIRVEVMSARPDLDPLSTNAFLT
jgi:hypothetical protein